MKKVVPTNAEQLLQAFEDKLGTRDRSDWQHYTCTLVTPLYGGGVQPGEVDTDLPIRATSIRGQLRFWWRLLHRQMPSEQLFEAEKNIWGGLGDDEEDIAASRAILRVDQIEGLKHEACANYTERVKNGKTVFDIHWHDWANSPYALFPAQGKPKDQDIEENQPKLLAKPGLKFRLSVRTRDLDEAQRQSVNDALRWWATFGGLGARTRRGLGAVEVCGAAGTWLTVSEAEVTAAGLTLFFRPGVAPADQAWKQGIEAMREFRQGAKVGRNEAAAGSKSPAGRSRWPEAAAIRTATNTWRVKTGGISFQPTDTVQHFPRAAFGLPIIFHFQGEKTDTNPDPGDTQLAPSQSGAELDRMASPLILRPYRIAEGKWRSALLKLPDEHVWSMDLVLCNSGQGKILKAPKTYLAADWWPSVNREALAEAIPPMQGRGSDALTAFMAWFSPPPITKPPAEEERWDKARIKHDTKNGSTTAIRKDKPPAVAIRDEGRAIYEALSPKAKAKMQQGYFQAAAIVQGTRLLRVEETA